MSSESRPTPLLFRFEAEILPDLAMAHNAGIISAQEKLVILARKKVSIPSIGEVEATIKGYAEDLRYGYPPALGLE